MTEVYLARDAGAQLERLVVVKRMLPHLLRDKKLVEGFLSEARVASGLDHSNLVRVERIAREEGQCYYAMEYVRGVDLRRLLSVLAKESSTMSFECAIAIAIELCAALGRVHEHLGLDGRPIVHRDVAPSNVLLSATGEVKLTDFGRQMPAKPARERTIAGTVRKRLDLFEGTIGYMSPEQCLGEPLDGRSDIYSLGVILYEMTTGMRLCDPGENDFQIMERTVRGWVTPPFRHRADYPEELQAVVMRAIERDPGRRYQAIGALQRALEGLQPAPASALAELVALATPRAQSASELAPVPSLEDRPTVVHSRDGSSPKPALPAPEPGRPRWLRPPWPHLALGGAVLAGILIALVTMGGGDGSANAAAPAASITSTSAKPAAVTLPPIEVIVPNTPVPGADAPPPIMLRAPRTEPPAPRAEAPAPRIEAPAPRALAPAPRALAPAPASGTAKPAGPITRPPRVGQEPPAKAPATAPAPTLRAKPPAATKPRPASAKPAPKRKVAVKSKAWRSPFLPVRPISN